MSIVVEQGCFQRELRITGNSNKLIYFCKAASRVYSTKPLHLKSISLTAETLALIYVALKVLETSMRSKIGPLQDPVTWYGINNAGTQTMQ